MLLIYNTNVPKIKTIKPIYFQKENNRLHSYNHQDATGNKYLCSFVKNEVTV